MDHPITDIVCLVHNQLETTKRFVSHVFDNTLDFRLTFVNNGCTDKTPEYLSSLSETSKNVYVLSPRQGNLGIIRGRNYGMNFVKTLEDHKFLVNLDNDQFVKKGWLEMLFSALENNNAEVAGVEAWKLMPPGSQNNINIGGEMVSDSSYFPFKRCTRKGEKYTYIGCGGMLINRIVYDKIGLFDEQFSPAYFEDPDFAFRCAKNMFKQVWVPDCPIDHLAHQTIMNQNLFEKGSQFLKSWKRFQKKWNPYFPGGV